MPPTFSVQRLCSTCKRCYDYPLAEGWITVGTLFRCPLCAEQHGDIVLPHEPSPWLKQFEANTKKLADEMRRLIGLV
jgi:hypothetical protein